MKTAIARPPFFGVRGSGKTSARESWPKPSTPKGADATPCGFCAFCTAIQATGWWMWKSTGRPTQGWTTSGPHASRPIQGEHIRYKSSSSTGPSVSNQAFNALSKRSKSPGPDRVHLRHDEFQHVPATLSPGANISSSKKSRRGDRRPPAEIAARKPDPTPSDWILLPGFRRQHRDGRSLLDQARRSA